MNLSNDFYDEEITPEKTEWSFGLKQILEKQKDLGMLDQVQRRYMLRPRTLEELKKLLERDLRADPDGTSEIAFVKKILILVIDELLQLKGV